MGDIAVWLEDFITEFREQSESLSQEERSRISNLDDFFPPCQILLLWFQDVNLQYLICFHDPQRDDMTISVEGPIPTYEAIGRMNSILADPNWDRQLSGKEKEHIYDKTVTFARILEGSFLNILQEIRRMLFQEPTPTSMVGSKFRLTSRGFMWTIRGNIAEIDKKSMVAKLIKGAKKQAAKLKAKPPAPQPPKPLIKSCVTHFYPPIWVGKQPRRTFKQKAHGAFIFPEKALDLKYKDRIVVLNQDGLIALGEESVPKATRMLNEIMATFLLVGFPASAVREPEVSEGNIDPSSLTITSWSSRATTLRTQFLSAFPSQRLLLKRRYEISKDDLKRVIKQAERISYDPEISDFLSFFLQAYTHLENAEYSQSFIMSWVIVERQMLWLWKKFLKEERMSRKRRGKLANPAYWTIDFVLEGLSIGGRLSQKDYESLMSLKNKRNDIIHLGESTTADEAEKCFKIARDIVKQRSGLN